MSDDKEQEIMEKKKRLASQMPDITRQAEQRVVKATVDVAQIDAKTKDQIRKIRVE
jgi:hypothetical protein